jgi:hypothetical protein
VQCCSQDGLWRRVQVGLPVHQVGPLPESFALPSNFLPCYLFWLVVCHDSDNHHDGIMGMKEDIGKHVELKQFVMSNS